MRARAVRHTQKGLRMMRVATALLLTALLSCAPAPRPNAFSAEALASCQARGGTVAVVGLSIVPSCSIPYADGGRFCSDSVQCTGHCLAAVGTNGRPVIGPGRTASGQCEYSEPVGSEECRVEVRSGRVAPGCAMTKDPS